MSSDIAIKVENLSKCYQIYDTPRDRLKQFILPRVYHLTGQAPRQYFREFWALKDVSFEVKKGETIGIIGRNGSGKSTLLQLICGTLSPTSGSITTNGRIAALLELGSGFNPEFTGCENVYMNASVLGLSKEEIDARFEDIAAFADIGEFIEQPVKTYSSGMMVRLAFAVIAHVDADILVIDEALAVGDAYFTQKCMRFLRAFKEHGTLLFVSHDTSTVVNLCNRAFWLDKGCLLVANGSAKEVTQTYLKKLYAGHANSLATSIAETPKKDISQVSVMTSVTPLTDTCKVEVDRTNPLIALTHDSSLANISSSRFGTGQAEIIAVSLTEMATGHELLTVSGQEEVLLTIRVRSTIVMTAPIIGFIVKDRLGQHLFGDNTYKQWKCIPIRCDPGSELTGQFQFHMPILPKGEYSIAATIAEGTQLNHVVHEWVHEALIFQSHSDSVTTGLVGIPMLGIVLCASLPAKQSQITETQGA
ncbi:ABC transporter ATP-binding protein [Betaproteobacteria bacterium PRO4]|nr:ABC transporter ATP-binding protein [Betaproteobacteria bacterium PRO4]